MQHYIETRYTPATSRYGAHMGTCYHYPEQAEAWVRGGSRVTVTAKQYPDLEPHALVEKAVAILRAQVRQR